MKVKKILVTGQEIDTRYNRTLVILNGLKKLGFEIIEYNFKKFDKESARKIRELSAEAYFTYIPSFGHKSVSFVKKNSVCDVVFDPLISKYMTNIKDYRLSNPYGYEAFRSKYRDRSSVRKADFVIFDTYAHQDYFIKNYKLDIQKTGVVHIGANLPDNQEKAPTISKLEGIFRIGFVGHFIPLQGVVRILETARLMSNEKDVEFFFIGKGFEFELAKKYVEEHQLNRVVFEGMVDYNALESYIKSFDLCMGIFGNTLKADVVIPNKIFNYATYAKPVITMESQAIKEVFTHKEDIYLCKPGAAAMVKAIQNLKEDTLLRKKLGDNIFKTVMEKHDEKQTATSLLDQYKTFKNQS
ncbi:glycosyltransferase [Salegentibacter sp. F188]|uniref:Glycosyltransferase n=1 Tax=Autumnicola patrickiae TaxID=3075591 RepID=A0ABU3DXP7_9FLAO|nr:glycosyltransferase [Salegentibacter sp. F188]MDT0688473.1 glycosyltransferase [Salegentibacter sp. F188]